MSDPRTRRAFARIVAALVSTFVHLATASYAETVESRRVTIEIGEDGLLERTELTIRLDDQDDTRSWSTYRLFLEANRELESLDIRVESRGGRVRTVTEDARERVPRRVGGVLFSSQVDLLVDLAPLAVGDRLTIAHGVRFRPYFEASHVNVRGVGAVGQLAVRVTGGGEHLRWHLDGPADGLDLRPIPSGVEVTGRDLAALEPAPLAMSESRRVRLAFAWDESATWPAVARWYQRQVDDLPPPPATLAESARQAVEGAANGRERLDRVIDFMDRHVRYVAVTVGEGNVRPSATGDTLARGWGDCKDKAVLLASMLASVGIEAYPALVRSDARGRVDRAFPALFPFNHAITAVPLGDQIEAIPGDPVSGGYLFVDTTQSRAAGRWLAPRVQGQQALIVKPGGGHLVSTPIVADHERKRLDVTLSVDEAGHARGRLDLEISGRDADRVLGTLGQLTSAEARSEARSLLTSLLPGATFDAVEIEAVAARVPTFRVAADLALDALVRGLDGARPSMRLPGMRAAPEPRLFEGRSVGMVVPPTTVEATWRLRLTGRDHCAVPEPVVVDAAPVGRFAQEVRFEDGELSIARGTRIERRFIEADALPILESLALAEHRSHRRRVRLSCATP